MEKIFQKILTFILYLLIFLFPFFFLNFIQEFFVTNKLYLLTFGSLLLVLISTIQILFIKKISWRKNSFDNLILLFLTSVALSTLFSSPNKIQALLNPNFGLMMMITLVILYFYISRFNSNKDGYGGPPLQILYVVSVLLSAITIVLYFQPFKNPGFTPIGSQLDLAIILGFGVVWELVSFPRRWESRLESPFKKNWIPVFTGMTLMINLLALFLTVYSLVKPPVQTPNLGVSTLILPPFRLSWFAALEILKNPQTAIIGIGPDNFSAIFTRVKDFAFNQSPLWQINSFNVSRSAVLQILTETGIFGLLSFGLLIFNIFRVIPAQAGIQSKISIYLFIYLIICLFIFPSSLIVWFLFFIVISQVSSDSIRLNPISFDLSDFFPLYLGIIIISFGLIGVSGYFLSRSYASEYYFKKSIDGIKNNKLKEVYDSQKQAIILNPFIERFRSSFAQTNLTIANNLSQKKTKETTEQDRQSVTQAIQTAISEGKVVVSLNPQKAGNWHGLALIYLNILNAAKDADVWTISAYQRAILADPQNPVYRVGMGGVYYSLKKYDDAVMFFGQAVSLKPDWPNANYNYAWAHFQKENYPQAVNALQATLKLLDPKRDRTDYDKVKKELEKFKKMLP